MASEFWRWRFDLQKNYLSSAGICLSDEYEMRLGDLTSFSHPKRHSRPRALSSENTRNVQRRTSWCAIKKLLAPPWGTITNRLSLPPRPLRAGYAKH